MRFAVISTDCNEQTHYVDFVQIRTSGMAEMAVLDARPECQVAVALSETMLRTMLEKLEESF